MNIINNVTTKTKCDVKDCKNDAVYFFAAKGRTGKFFVCKECLRAIADKATALWTPKSPKNTIKKIIDSKTQGDNR